MNITIENIDETRRSATIVVPAENIKEEERKILKAFAKKANIPGFRPGKAPGNMIKAKYPKALKDELYQKVSSKAYQKLIEQNGEDIYSVVDVKLPDVSIESNATIVFLFDVRPEVHLPEYKEFKVKIEKQEVTEEEIQKAIDNIRSQRAEYNVVEEAAVKGDYAKVSYEGKIDGKSVTEIVPNKTIYGKQENTWEEVGAADVPGVRAVTDALAGMKPGDETEVTMDFPAEFEEAELAGKKAVYQVTVHEVRQKVLPEMNEKFFEAIDVKDLGTLEERVKIEFQNRRKKEEFTKAREQLLDQINSSVTIKVPESAIEEQSDAILRDYMTHMLKQRGIQQDQFEQKKKELLAQSREESESRAKTLIVLDAIAKKEDIKLEDKDLNMSIIQEAMMVGMKPDELVQELKKDRRRLEQIRQNALANKVLDFLSKEANFEDIET